MTFAKFQELLAGKYPDAEAFAHSEFERGERGTVAKVTITFRPGEKAYMYRVAYEDVLCKVGIPVISRERLESKEATLRRYEEEHGTEDVFGFVRDYSGQIAEWREMIEDYRANYTIV